MDASRQFSASSRTFSVTRLVAATLLSDWVARSVEVEGGGASGLPRRRASVPAVVDEKPPALNPSVVAGRTFVCAARVVFCATCVWTVLAACVWAASAACLAAASAAFLAAASAARRAASAAIRAASAAADKIDMRSPSGKRAAPWKISAELGQWNLDWGDATTDQSWWSEVVSTAPMSECAAGSALGAGLEPGLGATPRLERRADALAEDRLVARRGRDGGALHPALRLLRSLGFWRSLRLRRGSFACSGRSLRWRGLRRNGERVDRGSSRGWSRRSNRRGWRAPRRGGCRGRWCRAPASAWPAGPRSPGQREPSRSRQAEAKMKGKVWA